MSNCQADRPAPLRCPDVNEVLASLFALLPHGRAWQSNEGGPQVGSVLYQFWYAIAAVATYVSQRFCDLRLEFWCATQVETNDLWMLEYGLPDLCDPFPDLCTKVAAIGGTRCEYYAEIAARAGWSIDCQTIDNNCSAGAGIFEAGCSTPGGDTAPMPQLIIYVHLNESAAFVGAVENLPFAGNLSAGFALACEPDITPLQCVLDRVVHAHIGITYITTEG